MGDPAVSIHGCIADAVSGEGLARAQVLRDGGSVVAESDSTGRYFAFWTYGRILDGEVTFRMEGYRDSTVGLPEGAAPESRGDYRVDISLNRLRAR